MPQDTPCAYAIWRTDDVGTKASEMGVKLGEGEAAEVLELMHRKHDCTIGMNWDVMGYWIREVVGRRKK